VLSKNAAEKQEECKAVDNSTGSDVPSRLAYKKSECTASYPDGKEYIRGNVSVKVEQAPHQEE
jgi:hypothetical protein